MEWRVMPRSWGKDTGGVPQETGTDGRSFWGRPWLTVGCCANDYCCCCLAFPRQQLPALFSTTLIKNTTFQPNKYLSSYTRGANTNCSTQRYITGNELACFFNPPDSRNSWQSTQRYVVCFLLGNSPAFEFYMPTFRNTLFHFMKMEQSVPKRRHIKFRRQGITQKKSIQKLQFIIQYCI